MRALRVALRRVKLLPPEEYNEGALACLLIRVWAGHTKFFKTMDELGLTAMYETGRRLFLYKKTNEVRHLIDGLRYLFGELVLRLHNEGPACLTGTAKAYQDFLKTGSPFANRTHDDRLSMYEDRKDEL